MRERITNSYYLRDIHKAYKKRVKNPLPESDFRKVIKYVDKGLVEYIIDGGIFDIPSRMGHIALVKKKNAMWFEDGVVKTTRPIDWERTNKLWAEDEDAKQRKILVRRETDYTYYLKWYKDDRTFMYHQETKFSTCRPLKRYIKECINNGKIKGALKAYEAKHKEYK